MTTAPLQAGAVGMTIRSSGLAAEDGPAAITSGTARGGRPRRIPARQPSPVPGKRILMPNDPGTCPVAAPLLTWLARPGASLALDGRLQPPMTGPAPAAPADPPPCGDLAVRLFRALYVGYDLHTVAGVHIAVPKGVPCFAGPSLGEIARRISAVPPVCSQPRQEGASP